MAGPRGFLALAFLALGVAFLVAGPAAATHDPNKASGEWQLNFPANDLGVQQGRAKTAKLRLRAVSRAQGEQARTKFKWGSWLRGECGIDAEEHYIGSFQRDTDSGPVVGCVSQSSNIFSAVFYSSKYLVEGAIEGGLPGTAYVGVFPARPRDAISSSFVGHFAGDGSKAAKGDRLGVGIVPFLNAGDETEQVMHNLVGSFEDVSVLYNPPTSQRMFDVLRKLPRSRKGKLIDYIVIAGHGSRASPRIDLSDSDLGPETVDLPAMRRKVKAFEKVIGGGGKLTPAQQQQLASTKAQIGYLEAVSEAMAPDAEVLLINCSPAATPEGKQFLRNLGEVLLGKRGGVLVASRKDVELGQVRSIANKIRTLFLTGKNVEIGDYFVSGAWERFPIKPRAR